MSFLKNPVPSENCGKCGMAHTLLASKMDKLNNMRKEGTLCDVTLLVQGLHLTAHRAVLASASKFFDLMFTTAMIESTSPEVELVGAEPYIIELLLEFIYTTKISINNSNVVSLLSASNQYQIEPVKEMCEGFLKRQVDGTNCLEIFALADFTACQELKEVAEDFLLLHFNNLYKKDEFLQLHLTQVVYLLHQDKLIAQSEAQIYEAAMRWLKYDICSRGHHIVEVLGCVRFCLVPKIFLKTILAEPLILDNPQCMKMVLSGREFHCGNPKSPVISQPRCNTSVIAVFGGPQSRTTYYFIPKHCTWAEISYSSVRSNTVSTAVFCDNIVYIIGGKSYNVLTNQWQLKAALPVQRDFIAACVSEGKIYTSGGTLGKLSVTLFERYDTKTISWQEQPRMFIARHGHGSVEANGLIYVCGGKMGNSATNIILRNCEVYDPSTLQWRKIRSMNKERMNHGLVVVGNRIYALGGQGVTGALDSVEFYEIASNTWHIASTMPWKGVTLKCAAVGRIIYVLAGKESERTPQLKYVLEYHTHSDRWVICTRTQAFPFFNCLTCVINIPHDYVTSKCFKTFSVK